MQHVLFLQSSNIGRIKKVKLQSPSEMMQNSTKVDPNHRHATNQSVSDSTAVIISSLIPSHPNIGMISDTISSVFRQIRGLPPETPLLIAVDGVWKGATDDDRRRYHEMLANLKSNFPNATILSNNASRQGLTRNVYRAVNAVETEFLYLIQHDLMFIKPINHTALVKTFREYPGLLRVVRFNLFKNGFRNQDKKTPCYGEKSVLNHINGIHFTKTGHWSDK